jgi:tRNA pseudouridine38-40 synthase
MKIRMLVSYDGTDFCGWQKQKHGPLKSVAHVIEEALEKIFQQKILLFGSGRTDAGVHAMAQVCHFEVNLDEKKFNRDLAWALKGKVPDSITIRKVWIAPAEFHATLSATHKTYKYMIYNGYRRNPFICRFAAWARKPVNLDYLNQVTQYIIGTHDFKSFQSVGTPVHHSTREVMAAKWEWKNEKVLQFTITGSGFLKQMVRNIVGTMLMLEQKALPAEEMKRILEALDRKVAGPPAPPEGLFLWKVYYPRELDKKCREL